MPKRDQAPTDMEEGQNELRVTDRRRIYLDPKEPEQTNEANIILLNLKVIINNSHYIYNSMVMVIDNQKIKFICIFYRINTLHMSSFS